MSILDTTDTQVYFDVIDGWGGNLHTGSVISESFTPDSAHVYAASGTSPLKNGSVVMNAHNGTVPTVVVPLLDANVNLSADKQSPKRFWMVVEGNTELNYSSRLGGNKVVCLRGNFAVKTAHMKGTPTVGTQVTVEHGGAANVAALHPHQTDGGGAPGINQGRLAAVASGDPVLGTITNIETVDGVSVYTVEMSL